MLYLIDDRLEGIWREHFEDLDIRQIKKDDFVASMVIYRDSSQNGLLIREIVYIVSAIEVAGSHFGGHILQSLEENVDLMIANAAHCESTIRFFVKLGFGLLFLSSI